MTSAHGWRSSTVARFLPGLDVMLHYDRGWLRGDLLAGITVAAYLIPQVMAYAEVAGLPAVVGLWSSLAPLVVYAFLGKSRQLSCGPESTTALMTAVAVGALVGSVSLERRAEVAAALAVTVAAVCLVAFALRLGFLADLLSRPVLSGYLAGIAVLMIVSQLGKVTRVPVHGDHVVAQLGSFVRNLGLTNVPTLLLALGVLGLLLVIRRWARKLPGPLIAMLLAALVVKLAGLEQRGVSLIGQIPAGLPAPQLPSWAGLSPVALGTAALGIALVGYSDNVLTARAFAQKHGEPVDANQEFLALGAANASAGLFQGFPVSSSGSRTVLGDAMGARSQVYSLVAVVGIVATMVFFRPVLAAFPRAALGAVVIYAAIWLVDVTELRRIARFRGSELALALATVVAVLTLDVLAGIGFAVGLSVLDLLRRIAAPPDAVLGYVPGMAGMHDVDDYATAEQVPGLVVYRYDAPLCFANSTNFRRRALRAVAEAPTSTEWFVLNAEANVEVDFTSVEALHELKEELDGRGIVFAMARVKQDLRDQLARAGFVAEVGEDHIFPTLPTSVAAYADWYEQRHGHRPDGPPLPPVVTT